MNATPTAAPDAADPDLAEQSRPGYGVPSQDPRPGAQVPLPPAEARREAHSTLVGGGAMAGMATGAAVGGAVGGPLGVFVGGTLGSVAGLLGGAAAGSRLEPEEKPDNDAGQDRGNR